MNLSKQIFTLFFLLSILFFTHCHKGKNVEKNAKEHYKIEGFYIFPLKKIYLGATYNEVVSVLGKPTSMYKKSFKEPKRVKLAQFPKFDEQWDYAEGLANNWVFFKNGKVVAAFREESDW